MKYFCLFFFLVCNLVNGKVVPSLDKVDAIIKNDAGKEYYAQQMHGTKPKDSFGFNFYTNREDFSKILSVVDRRLSHPREWDFIGLKPWPSQTNTYIFIAGRENENPQNRKIVIAVLKKDQQGEFSLLAKPWTDIKDNHLTNAFLMSNDIGSVCTGNPERYDFASYRLSPNILAFGIRYIAHVGYSGGGAIDEAITLFAIIDGQLRPVFAAPTYHFANYAGDWHEDGTRDHDIQENEYIIQVLPTSTHGMKDLKWSELGKAKKIKPVIYRWNVAKKKYVKN